MVYVGISVCIHVTLFETQKAAQVYERNSTQADHNESTNITNDIQNLWPIIMVVNCQPLLTVEVEQKILPYAKEWGRKSMATVSDTTWEGNILCSILWLLSEKYVVSNIEEPETNQLNRSVVLTDTTVFITRNECWKQKARSLDVVCSYTVCYPLVQIFAECGLTGKAWSGSVSSVVCFDQRMTPFTT